MSEQLSLGLFEEIDESLQKQREISAEEDRHERCRNEIEDWVSWWGWEGPKVGSHVQIDVCIPDRADGTGRIYAYMEDALVESIDEENFYVIAVIDHHPSGWDPEKWARGPGKKNGTKVKLSFDEIDPPSEFKRN